MATNLQQRSLQGCLHSIALNSSLISLTTAMYHYPQNMISLSQFFPSKPVKNSLPNSPLLSLKRSFLLSFAIFFMSSGLSLKSPPRLALILEGVLDLGKTEWPCDTPQAVKSHDSQHLTNQDWTHLTHQGQLERQSFHTVCLSPLTQAHRSTSLSHLSRRKKYSGSQTANTV